MKNQYTIKKVPANEVDKLRAFIDLHWKKGHALAKSRVLLDYMHYNNENDEYNYWVAENNDTKEYDAVFGFIPTSQYDQDLKRYNDNFGALWKRRDDVNNKEVKKIGLNLLFTLIDNSDYYGSLGLSAVSRPIYPLLGMLLEPMNQFYILNDGVTDFKIADNVSADKRGEVVGLSAPLCTLKWVSADDIMKLNIEPYYRPIKSLTYFYNKYAKHPIYRYKFLCVYYGDVATSLLAVREVAANGAVALRIIDAIGKFGGNIYQSSQSIMREYGYEYIDFLNYGIPDSVMQNMGFRKLDLKGQLIIPTYFEPFERRNVEIFYTAKQGFENYVCFKGDGDQDRPSIIE